MGEWKINIFKHIFQDDSCDDNSSGSEHLNSHFDGRIDTYVYYSNDDWSDDSDYTIIANFF